MLQTSYMKWEFASGSGRKGTLGISSAIEVSVLSSVSLSLSLSPSDCCASSMAPTDQVNLSSRASERASERASSKAARRANPKSSSLVWPASFYVRYGSDREQATYVVYIHAQWTSLVSGGPHEYISSYVSYQQYVANEQIIAVNDATGTDGPAAPALPHARENGIFIQNGSSFFAPPSVSS